MQFNRFPQGKTVLDCFKLGRMKVLDWTPVASGDKVQAIYHGTWRMSPLKHPLKVPVRIDTMTCYMPWRQLVESPNTPGFRTPAAWMQMVLDISAGKSGAAQGIQDPLINPEAGDTIRWDTSGFGINGKMPIRTSTAHFVHDVWNEYVRHPNYHRSVNTGRHRQVYENSGANNLEGVDGLPTSASEVKRMYQDEDYCLFGRVVPNIPDDFTNPLTTYDVENNTLNVLPGSPEKIDLIQFEQQKVELQREINTEVDMRKYREYLTNVLHGQVSEEADYRPRILAMDGWWQSSFDVDGTAGQQFGETMGKSITQRSFGFPMFYAPEHGYIATFVMCRFPFILANAKHRYVNVDLGDETILKELVADPAVLATQPPQEWKVNDYIHSSSNTGTGFKYPYGQSWRMDPSMAHPWYEDRDHGFPVVSDTLANVRHLIECPTHIWQEVFFSDRLAHIQCEIQTDKTRLTMVPQGSSSVYAGV